VRILAVYSIKGGVGKTTTAVNLAYLSAASGARTLLWDVDPQGAATHCFRVRPKLEGGVKELIRGKTPVREFVRGTDFEQLDLLPSDFSNRNLDLALDATMRPRKHLNRLMRPLFGEYDHVYLDCGPGLTLTSEGVFRAADALIVPTLPSPLSLRTLLQLDRHLRKKGPRGVKVLPFYSMVDRRRAMHRAVTESREPGPFRFLESSIPYSSVIERMGQERNPLFVYDRQGAAAQAYEALWREILAGTSSMLGRIAGWLAKDRSAAATPAGPVESVRSSAL
jgi:cellulose biosynthesis protein BcsQ